MATDLIFIEDNRHFSKDSSPGFWVLLREADEEGVIWWIQKNKHEIDLSNGWIKGNPKGLHDFITTHWVWDGEHVILSRWLEDKETWEVTGFWFDPDKVTHYQPLLKPEPPIIIGDLP